MMSENNPTTSMRPSPSNAFGASAEESGESRRNKNARAWNALLSMSAIGVFLEGCGAGDSGVSSGGPGGSSGAGGSSQLSGTYNPALPPNTLSYAAKTDGGVEISLANIVYKLPSGYEYGNGIEKHTPDFGIPTSGEAATGILHLIGSSFADTLSTLYGSPDANVNGGAGNDKVFGGHGDNTLQGGRGDDALTGYRGEDTYLFRPGDGTDTITDNGGKIVFLQGANNAYTGATYSFERADAGLGETVTLTVTKDGSTLNVIEFTYYPSQGYDFFTRKDGVDTEIPHTLLEVLTRIGSVQEPYEAGDGADTFTGTTDNDWVSYEGSKEGVTINLHDGTASGGWADGDELSGIDGLIGSDEDDTFIGDNNREERREGGVVGNSFEGRKGDDVFFGSHYDDTYLFNPGDGTDTINDINRRSKIVFKHETDGNDYEGATYTFVRDDGGRGEAVTLTVTKDGETLNVIRFVQFTLSENSFYARKDGVDTEISGLVMAEILGSEARPYLATADADTFASHRFSAPIAGVYNWVSYAGSPEGVNVDLRLDPATVSNGWADGDTLTNIRNIIGSDEDDTLIGEGGDGKAWRGDNLGANTLRGGAGNDHLEGGRGWDTLEGGKGNDHLDGGGGWDTLEGGAGNDMLIGGYGFDTYLFNLGDGTDTVVDSDGRARIVFDQGTHNAYKDATYSFEYIASTLRLTVAKDGNTLNIIDLTFYPGAEISGHGFFTGGTFSTRGGDEDDYRSLYSLPLPTRRGNEENPFPATDAAEAFTGTLNYNWVSYADSNTGVNIDLDAGTASGDRADGDTLTNIRNLIGSDEVDTMIGNGGANTLRGGAGNDHLDGGRNTDVLDGGAGNDVLAGGQGRDTYLFHAGDGTDTITDGGGNIFFLQGTDDDYTGATYSFVRADEGRGDTVTLTVTKDGVTLNVIEFTSFPAQHPAQYHAQDYNFATHNDDGSGYRRIPHSLLDVPEILPGGEGKPSLATHAPDTFEGETDGDWVSYENSDEGVTIELGTSTDPATASGGWAADDTLIAINNLIGSEADDTLTGNSADNTLHGGTGDDELRGKGGSDTYIFEQGDGTDLILSQEQDDQLGNKLLFRTLAEESYADTDFQFNRGWLSAGRELTKASQGDDLEIVVSWQGVETNRVIVRRYFDTADDAYTIYRNALSEDTIVSTAPAETS